MVTLVDLVKPRIEYGNFEMASQPSFSKGVGRDEFSSRKRGLITHAMLLFPLPSILDALLIFSGDAIGETMNWSKYMTPPFPVLDWC